MKPLCSNLLASLLGALVMALFSTLGDWIWARYISDGSVVSGVIHGALIFLVLGTLLAGSIGTPLAAKRLIPTLPVAGLLLAGSFYPLAWVVGYVTALLMTWMTMWLATAFLNDWARGRREGARRIAVRGAVAAWASGLAFWAISDIWTSPPPEGPDYPWNFACWTFAFLPGFLALYLGQQTSAHPPAS